MNLIPILKSKEKETRLGTESPLFSLLNGRSIQHGAYKVHIAQTSEDAHAITAAIRSAWGLDENVIYFYPTFNNPTLVYQELILPTIEAREMQDVKSICLIVKDQQDTPLGTGSLIIDHKNRTMEFGRAGTSPAYQGNGVLDAVTTARMMIARELNTSFALTSDSTTLTRAVQYRLAGHGLLPVAFHLSSFVIQENRVAQWMENLKEKHTAEIAKALLVVSKQSGLGRFATFFHLKPATELQHFYTPTLTSTLSEFFALTKNQLSIIETSEKQQRTKTTPETKDNPLTATRFIAYPDMNALGQIVNQARTDKFDTLIVQIPCDDETALHELEASGFSACGVFPNSKGEWLASFAYIVDTDNHKNTLSRLDLLSKSNFSPLAIEGNVPLVKLVHKAMEISTPNRMSIS